MFNKAFKLLVIIFAGCVCLAMNGGATCRYVQAGRSGDEGSWRAVQTGTTGRPAAGGTTLDWPPWSSETSSGPEEVTSLHQQRNKNGYQQPT